jgi:hypothetical protein
LLRYCLSDFNMIPPALIFTGFSFAFTFHVRWIYRFYYYSYYYCHHHHHHHLYHNIIIINSLQHIGLSTILLYFSCSNSNIRATNAICYYINVCWLKQTLRCPVFLAGSVSPVLLHICLVRSAGRCWICHRRCSRRICKLVVRLSQWTKLISQHFPDYGTGVSLLVFSRKLLR